jgi:hypothetical protein
MSSEAVRSFRRRQRKQINIARQPNVYEVIYPECILHDKIKKVDFEMYQGDYFKIPGIHIYKDGKEVVPQLKLL